MRDADAVRPDYVSIVELVPNHCAKCLEHFQDNPSMVGALASVGIEHGKSSGQMAKEFYATFHKKKHKEPR
jgi:hypothetical protein